MKRCRISYINISEFNSLLITFFLCSAFVVIQHLFSQQCNLIYKMRQTADPDRSINKLVCPLSFSTDL